MAMLKARLGAFFCGTAVVLSTPVLTSGTDLDRYIVDVICAPTDAPSAQEKRLMKLESLGDDARKALLAVASSRKPQAGCALYYLEDLREERAIPIIRSILRDPDAPGWLKEHAIGGVGVFKDMASFEDVLEAFQSGDMDLARVAAITLGELGDERGLRALRDALLSPGFARAKSAIVRAVGVRGHEAAVDLLLRIAGEPGYEESESRKQEVVLSLARIGTPRSRQLAVDLYGGISDEAFRGRLSLELSALFLEQRAQTHDEEEIRDINEQMARLRADPSASEGIKEIP